MRTSYLETPQGEGGGLRPLGVRHARLDLLMRTINVRPRSGGHNPQPKSKTLLAWSPRGSGRRRNLINKSVIPLLLLCVLQLKDRDTGLHCCRCHHTKWRGGRTPPSSSRSQYLWHLLLFRDCWRRHYRPPRPSLCTLAAPSRGKKKEGGKEADKSREQRSSDRHPGERPTGEESRSSRH